MIEANVKDRVEMLGIRAYDMFPVKGAPDPHAKDPFPMYSHERAASVFWSGFIEGLVERGLSDAEIEGLLRSKEMRWMFDQRSQELEAFAKSMVTDSLITAAKELGDE